MQWLPTVLSTVVFSFVCGIYFSARAILRGAEHEVRRFRGMAGRVVALEGQLEELRAQHQKLNGRFYALRNQLHAWNQDYVPVEDTAPTNPEGSSYDICENWTFAQLEGPQSKAAKCTCAYCEAMRERRRELRKSLAPNGITSTLAALRGEQG